MESVHKTMRDHLQAAREPVEVRDGARPSDLFFRGIDRDIGNAAIQQRVEKAALPIGDSSSASEIYHGVTTQS